ncbi:two pore domain potassium channel family protein [bacterium]|nr:MAG: two pore domain potassium channel family protein [bacterium]
MKDKLLLQPSFLKGRFLFLLISLLLLFFLYPFVERSSSGFRILDIIFLVILLSGINAISESKRIFIIALILALTGFGSTVLNYYLMSGPLRLLGVCIYGLFFTLTAVVILSHVMKDRKVTTDTILGSLCGYLLLGIVWTMLFALVELLEPGSFLSGGRPLVDMQGDLAKQHVFANFIYYSFVTLTTLGYGDITPASPPARALSSLEAVTGQLYIAVLIARLVGLHIVHASEKKDDS